MMKYGGALTGDGTNMSLYMAIGAAALLAILIIIFVIRRKKH